MKRGDLITIALQGDFGKPRPAVVVQSDIFDCIPTITVLPVTSDLQDIPAHRLAIFPDESNGLLLPSEIMVDKIQVVHRNKAGSVFGRLSDAKMLEVSHALAVFLGIV